MAEERGASERRSTLLSDALQGLAAARRHSPHSGNTSPKSPRSPPRSPQTRLQPTGNSVHENPNLLQPLLVASGDPRASVAPRDSAKGHPRLVSLELPRQQPPPLIMPTMSTMPTMPTPDSSPTLETPVMESTPEGVCHSRPDSSAGTPSRHAATNRLSLQDLKAHSPWECEAQAYLQQYLDEVDPTGTPSNVRQTILGNVPEEATAETFLANDLPNPKLPRDRTRQRRVMTATEELWSVTSRLQRLEGTIPEEASSVMMSTAKRAANNVDRLATNAAMLFKSQTEALRGTAKRDNRRHITEQAADKSLTGDPIVRDEGAVAADWRGDDGNLNGSGYDHEQHDMEAGRHRQAKATTSVVSQARKSSNFKEFEAWVRFQPTSYAKFVLIVILLSTGIACVLFYAGNPPCGPPDYVCQPKDPTDTTDEFFGSASSSWWLLFLCVRQVITLSLAVLSARFLVDFLALRTKLIVRAFGPFVSVFIVQARGVPLVLVFWGIYDFLLLYGHSNFVKHWLFWQSTILVFSTANPASNVVYDFQYKILLIMGIIGGLVVAVKRFWVGLYLGRQTVLRHADDLSKVMNKAYLISQVAALSRDIKHTDFTFADIGIELEEFAVSDDEASVGTGAGNQTSGPGRPEAFRGGLDLSLRRDRINELLGDWEEPEDRRALEEKASIAAIIQFRQSVNYLNSCFPFSMAFGKAETRLDCVQGSENVFNSLLSSMSGATVLKFDVIALLAIRKDGELNEEKLKSLIKLFRPDREGNLSLLDFAKSIDTVYKELRLLRANVVSSSKIDSAFEAILNVFFYFILAAIGLAAFGVDPWVLFASISGFILGFAFMFGPACSNAFEGIVLILVRKPYDVGDRINVSSVSTQAPTTGSPGWVVKDVTLFTTTVMFATTNEVATYSNGSLAGMRIINDARSNKAMINFALQFPIDTPHQKLVAFRSALEKFVKNRPREWAMLNAFRCTLIQSDLGYVEYTCYATHREAWQNSKQISDSKSDLQSFCLELANRMNMRYRPPALPVDLTMRNGESVQLPYQVSRDRANTGFTEGSADVVDAIEAMFAKK